MLSNLLSFAESSESYGFASLADYHPESPQLTNLLNQVIKARDTRAETSDNGERTKARWKNKIPRKTDFFNELEQWFSSVTTDKEDIFSKTVQLRKVLQYYVYQLYIIGQRKAEQKEAEQVDRFFHLAWAQYHFCHKAAVRPSQDQAE